MGFKQKDRYFNGLGLYIDIFPIDSLCDSKQSSINIFKRIRFKYILLISAQWKNFTINKEYGFLRQVIRLIFFVLSRFVNSKKIISKLNLYKNISKTTYCGSIFGSTSKNYEIFNNDIFDALIYCEFEDKSFKIIAKYDDWLKIVYGNYLMLPPKNKQIAKHNFKVYTNID